MNVHAVVLNTTTRPAYTPRANYTRDTRFGPLEVPPNGNPGIVPPWLTKTVDTNVIGINPVDPDVPHIM